MRTPQVKVRGAFPIITNQFIDIRQAKPQGEMSATQELRYDEHYIA